MLNRLTDKKFPGNSILDAQYKYDLGSRLTDANIAAVDGAKNSFTYDNLNRMNLNTQILPSGTYVLDYDFDKAGNRTKATYPSGKVVEYTYDGNDRMDFVKVSGRNFVDYSYDPLDRRSQKDYLAGAKQQTIYGFDIANQLKNLTNKFTAGGNISQFGYPDYDNAGNRLTMTRDAAAPQMGRTSSEDEATQTTSYGYNDIYELTSVAGAQTHSYTHDNVGNREVADGVPYVPNTLNQYDSVGGVSYSYDGNGNLGNDGRNAYTYDEENRLSLVQNVQHSANYEYDAFNYRISKRVDGLTTYFIYDGDEIIEDRGASGNLLAEYVYGDYIDEILAMSKDNKTYYYHTDALGSITDITDSQGNIIETYTYDVYGLPSRLSTIGNRYMFTGREFDEESGTYYYRLRNYHSQIGRFLQRDPIGYWDSMNLYEFVFNNPINWIDPWGEQVYFPPLYPPMPPPYIPPLPPIGPPPIMPPQPGVSVPNAPKPNAPGAGQCLKGGGPGSGNAPMLSSSSGNQGSGGSGEQVGHRKEKGPKGGSSWNRHTGRRSGGPEEGDKRRDKRVKDKKKRNQ